MTSRTEFGVLGRTTLRVDGVEIGLRSQRACALVAALVLARGRSLSVAALCEALWGEQQPQDPAAALHNQVSRLRGILGAAAGAIETAPGGYRLSADDQDIDADLFASGVEAAQAIADPRSRAAALLAVLDLWRGRAYDDLDTADARAEASRLEELRLAAHEDAGAALLDAGEIRAASVRLAALCTSEPLRERSRVLLAQSLAADGRTADALRTLDDYRRRLAAELGADPSPVVGALTVDILNGWPASQASPGRAGSRLDAVVVRPPRVVVSVFGREADCRAVREALAADRLVTIIGPGGVGKTTLALLVADEIETSYPHGAVFVDLSVTSTATDVDAAFTSALGLERRAGVPGLDRLVEALVGRRLLLVVDNAEQVADAVSPVIDAVLRRTDADIVVTARQPLNVRGERLWPIEPLDVDAGPAAPSVLLFQDRGRAVRPTWDLSGPEREACVDICRQLDGLPLAIELAAANLRTLSCTELRARLRDPFELLADGPRQPARHRTLRAMVDWSYAMLDEVERAVFDRLGVFAGWFRLSSAARVCTDLDLSASVVEKILRGLVDRSLVRADVGPDRTRFSLLETLRLFARDRLAEAGQLEPARARHAAVFLALAEQVATDRWGADEGYWTRTLEDERAELSAAHHWLVSCGDIEGALRLATAAYLAMFDRGREDIGGLVDSVVTLAPGRPEAHAGLWAIAFGCAADRANTSGDLERGAELVTRAQSFAEASGVAGTRVLCEGAAGDLALFTGQTELAAAHYRAAADDARAAGLPGFGVALDAISALPLAYAGSKEEARQIAGAALESALDAGCPSAIAMARYVLAEAVAGEEAGLAEELLTDAIATAAAVGNVFVSGIATVSLATLTARVGARQEALRHYRVALDVWRRAGNWTQQWNTLRTLTVVLTETGRDVAAAQLFGGVEANALAPRWGEDEARLLAVEQTLRSRLGEVGFDTAVKEGARLGAVEVLALAESSIDAALN